MPVPSTISDLSTSALLNSPAGTDPVSNTLDDYLRATQAILKTQFSAGSTISVTGSTITIPESNSFFNVSAASAQSVTSFSSNFTGRVVVLRFIDSNITLQASGNLILPQNENFNCTEYDVLTFVSTASGTWALVSYANATRTSLSQIWTAEQFFDALTAQSIVTNSIVSQSQFGTSVALGSGAAINMALGSVFTKTITGSTTFSVTNIPISGVVGAFILDITNGGSASVSWWSGVVWQNGRAPTLTASGRDLVGFLTYDGGTTWNGIYIAQNLLAA